MKKLLATISAFALAVAPVAPVFADPAPASLQIDRSTGDICANATSTSRGCQSIGKMLGSAYQLPSSTDPSLVPAAGVNKMQLQLPSGAGAETVGMPFVEWLKYHVPVGQYGAACIGGDDTAGLQRAMSAFSITNLGYHLELPNGRFCHFNKPLVFNSIFADMGGVGGKDSGLLIYNGPATVNGSNDVKLLSVGTGRPQTTGATASRISVHDLSITSDTRMLGGAAIYQTNAGDVSYNNIRLVDPNLWNGADFHQVDYTRFTNFSIATRNECVRVSGNGAENPAGATGPQYDLWLDGGKITGCHIGVHVGGGFDGVSFDHIQNTTVDINTAIDETILGDDGLPHPNQEVWFGSQYVQAFANWDNMVIDEPLAKPSVFATISVDGYITIAGNAAADARTTAGGASAQPGVSTGSFAGVAPPANSGNGVHIKRYPGGHVHLKMAYAWDFANAFVFNEDANASVYQAPAMDVAYAKYGYYSTNVGWAGMQGGVPKMTGVGTAFVNTNTPDLRTPFGRLLVGLGAATNPYAQSVISNGGAETVETALGTAFGLAANAIRELFINRSTNAYADHTMDGASHHLAVQGADQVVVTAASTQLKNNLITLPASPPSNGGCVFGQIAVDAGYVYVCTAANTWKRSALSAY